MLSRAKNSTLCQLFDASLSISASHITSIPSAFEVILQSHAISVFFSLFSEVEPFAAMLTAHGTHVFWGGLLWPEGLKFEAKGREWERGSWGGNSESLLTINYIMDPRA